MHNVASTCIRRSYAERCAPHREPMSLSEWMRKPLSAAEECAAAAASGTIMFLLFVLVAGIA